ncbi:MAG: HEAT repeat domain-containing protein [Gemmatimonadota bacterium]|jgi:protein-S-isoprenylcysteine O-methyltransferase Ste14
MMTGRFSRRGILRGGSLLLLALVFTVGLTFATLELPYYLDGVLQNVITTPGGDSHVDEVARLKTDLFMAHYHVRAVGYVGFFLLVGLIVAGFATDRTRLAAVGGVGVMLAAFAQFAGVMFFLAGLGVLNALWLPILDVSYELQSWGLVIRAPDDLLRWMLGLVGVHSRWPTILLFTGGGILLFVLSVYAWLSARARGKEVADFWVYRISRHPQYLGWVLWTYGAFLLIQLMRYPKRSWGIGASLPWLVSTMVILGVALLEELNMRRRHGPAYEAYRERTPFLFPVPAFVGRIATLPLRLIFGKEEVERRREVAVLVGVWTALLMTVSAIFYAGGLQGTRARLSSPQARAEQARALVAELRGEESRRRRFQLSVQVASLGEDAVGPLAVLLEEDDAALRVLGVDALGSLRSKAAIPTLRAALSDSVADVRSRAIHALEGSGHPVPAEALVPLLDDPERHIQLGALAGLARTGSDVVLLRAPAFLADPGHWVRGAAVDALGASGLPGAVPLVEPCLSDPHPWVRRAAVLALLRIGSPAARPVLEQRLGDEDFEVRIYAAEALKRLPTGPYSHRPPDSIRPS